MKYNKRIKIAYVINSIRKNGPTSVLLNQINAIDKSEFDVTLITIINENDSLMINNLKEMKVQVIELKMKKNFLTFFNNKYIRNVVEEGGVDIIHTHSHVPTIMCQNIKMKKITTVHCRLEEDFCETYGWSMGKVLSALYVNALEKYDVVVGCSEAVNEALEKKLKNSTYINNGISSEHRDIENVRLNLGIDDNTIIYLYAGLLNDNKNVKKMIDVMSKNIAENEYFFILGDGPHREYVEHFSSTQVKLLGFQDNVEKFMKEADVYVSFSKSEGLSVSIIEALNKNMLLLLSDIPGHRAFFDIDKRYYLGELFTEENFQAKLNTVRRSIEKTINTKQFQEKHLSAKTMMSKYEAIYHEIIMEMR